MPDPHILAKIEERKARWLSLYRPECLGARLFLIHYLPDLPERPWPHPSNSAERVDWAWLQYQQQLNQMEWLEDDTIPFLDMYTGTEIFAAAFGCKVYYPDQDMPFAMPLIHSYEEVGQVQTPDLDAPVIDILFQMADELQRRAGPGALLRMVDLQTPMDIAALIWDKTTFYPALLQQPDAVRQLSHQVLVFMTRFLDAWFSRYGRAFISHYPDYYMPYGITLSEDEIGAVSGKVFNNLFLPELVELSEYFGQIGIHCCAHARHQWSNLLKVPNLVLLNLVQPPDVTRAAWDFFCSPVAQWHSYQGEGPAWTWPAQHPPAARMVYEVTVNSKEEAIETSRRMREVLAR